MFFTVVGGEHSHAILKLSCTHWWWYLIKIDQAYVKGRRRKTSSKTELLILYGQSAESGRSRVVKGVKMK